MALHTFGSNASSSLNAVKFYPPQGVGVAAAATLLPPADLASIAQAITDDTAFGTNPWAILATGSTHTSATLDTLVAVAGGPLASIQIGALVLGVGIVPGTFVTAKPSASSVTLSVAATASAAGVKIAIINPRPAQERFNFNGLLEIPNRGIVKVLPGDVVAVDNTGWPVLVSANSLGYSGSLWTYT